jgi:hypothetical protein
VKPIKRLQTRISMATTQSLHVALGRITMYDDIYLSSLPSGGSAYAGYVSGRWPTWNSLVAAKASSAYLLSIDPFATNQLCHCLDVESGDATNADILPWFREMLKQGIKVPVIYTSAGNVAAVIALMEGAGYTRTQFLVWAAHYTYSAHICSPSVCGYPAADATQWSDEGPGGCDVSAVSSYFFPWTLGTVSTPTPTTTPAPTPVTVPTTPVTVQDEEDEVKLLPGTTQPWVTVSLNSANAVSTIGFASAVPTKIAVSYHNVETNAWSEPVTATVGGNGVAKTVLSVPAETDAVNFERLDDVSIVLVPNFS